MTNEELNHIQIAEYEDAVAKLIDQGAFRLLLVQLYSATRPGPPTPTGEGDIPYVNFNHGMHVWCHNIVSWMEVHQPAVYLQFMGEVIAYDDRRRRSDSDGSDD